MKSINLTEKHKSKLLEMCRILFPEYKIIVLQENLGILTIDHLHHIHWFEFCMRDLQYRILGVSDYKTTQKFLMRTIFQCEQPHPIDYLYEAFKKLK